MRSGRERPGIAGVPSLQALRHEILVACGASAPLLEELLAYTRPRFDTRAAAGASLPLPDEPHVAAWREYERDAEEVGAFRALAKRFAQLRFPIREGISLEEDYRAATRRGQFPDLDASPGLVLNRPSEVGLRLHATDAGRVPILTAGDRSDFVSLVRAFAERNEPVPVPDSMGACIVTGLNNWDRVAAHRRRWQAARGAPPDDDSWLEEFARLVPRKELYQDRFIILSRGPYSAVRAEDAGVPADAWLERSLAIRREHECTHYFTYRLFGSMANNLLDEVLADFVGLSRVFGRYDGSLALRFFGLEAYPRYREGGRLEAYRGRPPLSDEALGVVRALVFRSVRNLEDYGFRRADSLRDGEGLGRLVIALADLTLEELASEDMGDRVDRRLDRARVPSSLRP